MDTLEESNVPLTQSNASTDINLIIEQLKEVVAKEYTDQQKVEVESIKQLFYKKIRAQKENATEENPAKDYSEQEALLKEQLNIFREKRNLSLEKENALRLENLQKKKTIIEKINAFSLQSENIHEHLPEFKQLQSEWKEIGSVPVSENANVYKEYNLAVEKFYDLLKINFDLRDYDFKKNLDIKTKLCENAEKLNEEENVITAFRALQNLHDQWAQTGPVAKEQREALWNRFKEASTVINKKHNAYFETKKQEEENNLQHKTDICKKIEAIQCDSLKTISDWEEKTKIIMDLQKEWRTIGYTARKDNENIYDQYRKLCDAFFSKKSIFFHLIFDEQNANVEKKQALITAAERLKEDTNWKETTLKFIDLQRQWKSIGNVPRKLSEPMWKQFVTACDYFFEQKEKFFASAKDEEKENLEKKIAVIEKLENLESAENAADKLTVLKTLIAEYNAIGHVPFHEKDKLFKRFRAACDKQFDALNVDASNRRIDSFVESIESLGDDKSLIRREREKLRHVIERISNDIKTSENNILFLSPNNAKKPNPLINEMKRNIEKMKKEQDIVRRKIALLNEKMQ